jgi:hypothetical protein
LIPEIVWKDADHATLKTPEVRRQLYGFGAVVACAIR